MRLDVYLHTSGLAKSRSRAAELIAAGYVTVDGALVTKAAYTVEEGDNIVVTGEAHSFVGRGGMKLDAALDTFGLDVTGMICADIGASTGGFTDVLLRRGAAHVYAVDAGHGQLDPTLASDSRVTNLEGCNARYLDNRIIPAPCSCAVADLSFISQTLVMPAVASILTEDAVYVALIKPQFECGRDAIGKGGIVKDKKHHISAIRRVLAAATDAGLAPQKLMRSPIPGGDGNTEFLFYAQRGGIPFVHDTDIVALVRA